MKSMKSIELFDTDDSRAVSPVIGVILMVAITVILAAVIGTFVLGLGDRVGQAAPQASLGVAYDDSTGNVTFSHNGGDPVKSGNVIIKVSNETGPTMTFTPGTGQALSVGDTGELNTSSPGLTWPNTVSIASSENSATLTTGELYTVQIIDEQSNQIIVKAQIET